ncbi:hypothetical protein FISHEDRAFT_33043 [Fistulina hepatica ATCC 64428]|uniref:Ubinuclein middle domain-containing protein n=1 Tax=Fistulina hepatica ATCC 64428 TaxID=1128425 RepID=A0A0D7APQ5_9AGAR|nr:hypothetical protein FISHEDRAFT_33043 [Fistulina hepatica ATCC 64428]
MLVDPPPLSKPSLPRSRPSSSSSSVATTALVYDDEGDEDEQEEPPALEYEDEEDTENEIEIVHTNGVPEDAPAVPPDEKPSDSPPPSAPSTKPKSTKHRHRSPSLSPPPPVPRPPVETVRLSIKLGGPENYEVDIAHLLKETGQRLPTPPPVHRDVISESEGEDEPPVPPTDLETGKKKKKRKHGNDYYDVNDPFIDDSELAIDERTFFAQTKQQGFYVSSGEVALMKDKSPDKKPKSRKLPLTAGSVVSHTNALVERQGSGTRDAPIALDDEQGGVSAVMRDEANAGQKRKRYKTVEDPATGKRRKIVDEASFSPELQKAFERLKVAIRQESWEVKGKFPPNIKPLLAEVALLAVRLDEYDEHFFSLMPQLFPYNKFTMTKLIKRTIFQDHTTLLVERQDALLRELAQLAQDGFPKAEQDYERSLANWKKRQQKSTLEQGGDDAGAAPQPPTRQGSAEDMDVDHDSGHAVDHADQEDDDGGGGGPGLKRDAQPPNKKYRMTEKMKSNIWQLVLLSNEICRLENEKNTFENNSVQISEQGLRKVLYQKIVAAFPEGWVTSGQISRDVSAIKKRLEKEAENQAD